MAIESGVIVGSIQDIKNNANQFETYAGELRDIANNMLALVEGTGQYWEGSAHTAYCERFAGLADEMEVIHTMVNKYCTDLLAIADDYATSEETNASLAGSLQSDYELIKA